MDRPDDLDLKSTEILEALRHAPHDGPAYWPAVHAVGALVAEIVRLRGERDGVVAWLHRKAILNEGGAIPWDDSELRQAAASIERGEHRREEGA
jgi:hypothetical protein